MLYTNPQEHVLILGPSGAGKHLFAIQRLVNSLADGLSAVVFDCGGSYAHIARALGGKLVTVDGRQRCTTLETYGTMPLTVYEVENIVEALDIEKLPNLPMLDATTFVLVDELWQMNQQLPGLWDWLHEGAQLTAGFCGVMQLGDVDLGALPERTRLQRIANFSRVETEHLQAGQLVRHQDGGIYRFHSNARHTDDQTELVIYEHVWPFTTGQVWARPAHEWPSRFTPITSKDLREALKQPREEAQAAITNAKATRRAEEARRKATAGADYNTLTFTTAGQGMSLKA